MYIIMYIYNNVKKYNYLKFNLNIFENKPFDLRSGDDAAIH